LTIFSTLAGYGLIAVKEKTQYFSACITENSQATNGKKSKRILKSREEQRRQNRDERVANKFFENETYF